MRRHVITHDCAGALQGISFLFLLLIFFSLTTTYLPSTTPTHIFITIPNITHTLQSTHNTTTMFKPPGKTDKVEWTAEKDKYLLVTLVEIMSVGEISRPIWDLAAELMGSDYVGFSSDKIS